MIINSRTVTGHAVQNKKVATVNSRVQTARLRDPSYGTSASLAERRPNTDPRRFVVGQGK